LRGAVYGLSITRIMDIPFSAESVTHVSHYCLTRVALRMVLLAGSLFGNILLTGRIVGTLAITAKGKSVERRRRKTTGLRGRYLR
jgi:hypothetical protein